MHYFVEKNVTKYLQDLHAPPDGVLCEAARRRTHVREIQHLRIFLFFRKKIFSHQKTNIIQHLQIGNKHSTCKYETFLGRKQLKKYQKTIETIRKTFDNHQTIKSLQKMKLTSSCLTSDLPSQVIQNINNELIKNAHCRTSSCLTKDLPSSVLGSENMKSVMASMLAIFSAALFWKKALPRVSQGLQRVLALRNSRSPNVSNTSWRRYNIHCIFIFLCTIIDCIFEILTQN